MKRVYLIYLLILVFLLTACEGLPKGNSVLPRRKGEEALTADENTQPTPQAGISVNPGAGSLITKRSEEETNTGVPFTEPDSALYEANALLDDGRADTNEYGTAPGNIYNNGQATDYIDGKYFLCTRITENYIVEDKWGYFLNGARLSELNYVRGKLCGIHTDAERAYDNTLLIYDVTRKTASGYSSIHPALILGVNGILFYTDSDTHMLIAFDPVELTEKIIVDDKVGDFTVFKDRIIFCNEADGGSLYSIPLTGGNAVKLNDRESTYPLVYNGKIYFGGEDSGSKKIFTMNMDGSEETAAFSGEYLNPVICSSHICFLRESKPDAIFVIDLNASTPEVRALEIADENRNLLAQAMGGIGTYKLKSVSDLAAVNGILLFRTRFVNDGGQEYYDSSEYDFDKTMLSLSTMLSGQESLPYTEFNEANPNMILYSDTESVSRILGLMPSNGHNYYSGLTSEEAQQSDKAALEIADKILGNPAYSTEHDMVDAAAKAVKKYCDRCEFTADEENTYRSPYGVFIAKKYSSAGSTRALGRVLDYMGIVWTHVNEGTGQHQYCEVTLDGNKGFADASVGDASYGLWSEHYEERDGVIWKKAETP